MIRPFTLIAAMMFVLSGAYLFAVKHRSQMLDDQIAATAQATRLDEQRIRVLQAQWALEADPSRLAQLSAKFTDLQPMKPGQLVTLATLASALPPAGSMAPGETPAMPAMLATASPQPVVEQTKVANAAPLRVVHVVRARQESGVREARMVNVEALLHSLPAHHVVSRIRHPALTREYAENRPVYTPSALAASSIPMPQPMMDARMVPVRAITQANAAPMPMDGGSMLGMAQGMTGNAN